MRIWIDVRPAARPHPAGIGRVVRCAVDALAAATTTHDVGLLTDRPFDGPPGCDVLRGPASGTAWQAWALARLLRDRDAVHVSLSSLIVPAACPSRSVVLVHDLSPLHLPAAHVRRTRAAHALALRRAVGRAAAVLANSAHTRDDLVRTLGVAPERIVVAHLGVAPQFTVGVPPAERVAAVRRLGLPDRFLLSLGTIEPKKDLDVLLRAYARLRASVPDAPPLVVAGARGWGDVPLDALARSLGLGASVRVAGWIPDADLPAVVASADALVAASRHEGFGLPVLEAMSMGTPVVAVRAGALPEIAGDAANLAAGGDPDDLAAQIARVLTEPGLSARLRAAGRERARRFTWSAFAGTLLAAVHGAFPDRRPQRAAGGR